jgi:queuine tRNA-ribosyltransferase
MLWENPGTTVRPPGSSGTEILQRSRYLRNDARQSRPSRAPRLGCGYEPRSRSLSFSSRRAKSAEQTRCVSSISAAVTLRSPGSSGESPATIVQVSLSFHIHSTLGPGRCATLTLPHGSVETPAFMPVGTQATVKAVPQNLLEDLDVRILLGNTYHLYLRPGHEAIRRLGGLHRFMSWKRPILTDSGGFQVFSLSDLRKVTDDGVSFRSHIDGSSHFFSPEHSMDVQIALGSDIAMAFDECTEYPADYARARASLDMTLRWATRSKAHHDAHRHEVPWHEEQRSAFSARRSEGATHPAPGDPPSGNRELATGNQQRTTSNQSLFAIVQGGMFPDLRRESAERLVEMDFPGYAIGGLSVGEPRELTREMIAATLPLLPADKPRYVMGVGYPDEIAEYARMGVDMMDCVLPTRAARHGLLFTSEGRLNIKNRQYAEDQNPPDPACACLVCRRYTRAYLRHLFVAQEPLSAVLNTLHNLAFYLETMRKVREEIAGPGESAS